MRQMIVTQQKHLIKNKNKSRSRSQSKSRNKNKNKRRRRYQLESSQQDRKISNQSNIRNNLNRAVKLKYNRLGNQEEKLANLQIKEKQKNENFQYTLFY